MVQDSVLSGENVSIKVILLALFTKTNNKCAHMQGKARACECPPLNFYELCSVRDQQHAVREGTARTCPC